MPDPKQIRIRSRIRILSRNRNFLKSWIRIRSRIRHKSVRIHNPGRDTVPFRRLGLVDRVVEGVEAAGFKCTIYDKELVYVYTQCQRGGRGWLEHWPLPAMRELSTSSLNCQGGPFKASITVQTTHSPSLSLYAVRSQCSIAFNFYSQ